MKVLFLLAPLLLYSGCHPPQKDTCINTARINPEMICTMQYDPVCGCNGQTYGNACEAERAGLTSWTSGECGEDNSD